MAATEIQIPLVGEATEFDLTKAVCSHGLFMMSPNKWDPLSRTLTRPLLLNPSASHSDSLLVSISHDHNSSHALLVRVHGTTSLSDQSRNSIVAQVVRMLRLSDSDVRRAGEFMKMMAVDGDRPWMSSFGGRVFRSPTLFEDMVKCILLCNCQWSRTLSMAAALCELQLELQSRSSNVPVDDNSKSEESGTNSFIPNTPKGKEPKRKLTVSQAPRSWKQKFRCSETDSGAYLDSSVRVVQDIHPDFSVSTCIQPDSIENGGSSEAPCILCEDRPSTSSSRRSNHEIEHGTQEKVGNFPSPVELANLDEEFLAKRCKLGYRAGRIIKLAKGIVEGSISLRGLEELCDTTCFSSYNQLADKLKEIDGFGPFTSANVLMCMGFYHVIPCDSETVRHLKQFHGRRSTIRTVRSDVEEIYEKYAPFQFIAYWAELWYSYEQMFGKLSDLPCSGYKIITASNMKMERSRASNKA